MHERLMMASGIPASGVSMKRIVPHPDKMSASSSIARLANDILAFDNISPGFLLLYDSPTLILNHSWTFLRAHMRNPARTQR